MALDRRQEKQENSGQRTTCKAQRKIRAFEIALAHGRTRSDIASLSGRIAAIDSCTRDEEVIE